MIGMRLDKGERRLQRARILRQERFLIAQFGVLHTTEGDLGEAEWRERRLAELHRRLTDKDVVGKQNALRAADIVRNGEASRWWFARHSRSHAGSDKHGIVHYLLRWRDEGRAMPEIVYHELRLARRKP